MRAPGVRLSQCGPHRVLRAVAAAAMVPPRLYQLLVQQSGM